MGTADQPVSPEDREIADEIADQNAWADIWSRWRYGWSLDQWDSGKRASVVGEALGLLGIKWPRPGYSAPRMDREASIAGAAAAEREQAARERIAALRAGIVAFLNVVSAAEAEGWTFAGGAQRMRAQHPITGDLYAAHAKLAALASPDAATTAYRPGSTSNE